jgi:hypothetical protein
MHLFNSFLKSGRSQVKEACESLGRDFPALMRHAIVVGIPVPGTIRWLGGYAMCLNHWLTFLPVPVILLNANWFANSEKLRERYRHDVATGYHPGGDSPARYVLAHEIAHFLYVRMGRKERKKWESVYEHGKPSGYSTTPEESFCEAFAGSLEGLEGRHYELASALARANVPGGIRRAP